MVVGWERAREDREVVREWEKERVGWRWSFGREKLGGRGGHGRLKDEEFELTSDGHVARLKPVEAFPSKLICHPGGL